MVTMLRPMPSVDGAAPPTMASAGVARHSEATVAMQDKLFIVATAIAAGAALAKSR